MVGNGWPFLERYGDQVIKHSHIFVKEESEAMVSKKRTSKGRRGHELTVRYKGHIAIAGAKADEERLRESLEAHLTELLRGACPVYFGRTSLPERYAFQIAWNARFVPSRHEFVRIKNLDVWYRNRKDWRVWMRVEDDTVVERGVDRAMEEAEPDEGES